MTSNLTARYYKEHQKLKLRAQGLIHTATRKGKLIPGLCEVCNGIFPKQKIEAHHDDYNKPLEVRWLCQSHHRQTHIRMEKLAREKLFKPARS